MAGDHGVERAADGVEIRPFADAESFDAWLVDHCDDERGVWLKLAKAGTGIASMTSDEAVDVGLCWGWISGQRRGLDETWYLQKYVPRRPRSRWSQVNVRKVEALTKAGRMQPRGQAEVDAARADGRWAAAYVSQKDFTVPDDLADALAESPRAKEAYDGLGRSDQYALVLEIVVLQDPARRAERVRRTVQGLIG